MLEDGLMDSKQNMTDRIYVDNEVDLDRDINAFNEALYKILDYSPERELLDDKIHLKELFYSRMQKMKENLRVLKKEIAARQEVESALRNEKEFSQHVIEAIPSIFYMFDENLQMVKWNKNFEYSTGYSPEEMRKFKVLDFVEGDDRNIILEKISETFQEGKIISYPCAELINKEGRKVLHYFTGVRTIINNKKFIIGVGIDISQLEKSKKALQEREMQLNLAAESAGAGLWSIDTSTGRGWATQIALVLHNLVPEPDTTLNSIFAIMHPQDRERVKAAIQDAIQSKSMYYVEYRIMLPDGNIRWLATKGRIHSHSPKASERLMGVSMDITERKVMEVQLKERLIEIEKLKKQLEMDNIYLRQEVKSLFNHDEIIGQSEAIKRVLMMAEQVAPTDSNVLILGETGTGKELIARAIHEMSRCKGRNIVTINCASLPPSLIESELFGREKGAYTGALTKMVGRFETANGSTLFLDEIGELPLELQSKLLRVLEVGKFERLGSTKTIEVNVRLIAATNRDLANEVREGRFRRDLYYRLNVFPVCIPPLRERVEDIPALVWFFVRQFEKRMAKRVDGITQKSMGTLKQYSWPGNIRELKNVIEHAMIMCTDKILNIELLATDSQDQAEYTTFESVESKKRDIERKYILGVLESTGWRIAGKNGAAEIIGIKRTTLNAKIKALGITRPSMIVTTDLSQ
jgi:PAS domain S-box-containing protein